MAVFYYKKIGKHCYIKYCMKKNYKDMKHYS